MRTRYDKLISLQVEHKYFANKLFDAFELIPDEKSMKSIRDGRLLIKKSQNTWVLLYQSKGPWETTVDAFVNKEFTFIFRIKDESFADYTHEDYLPGSKAVEFYAASINNKLFSSSRVIESPVFEYNIQHEERPVNLKLKKLKGEVLYDVSIIEPTTKSYKFDLSASEEAFDISENTLPVTDTRKQEIYVYRKYFDDPFYGVILFKVFPPAGQNSNQYNLLFEKK
jgi:hypothetical protein